MAEITLIDALAKAQTDMSNPESNCEMKMHGRVYKYPGLNSVVKEIREACNKHGVFFSQQVQTSEGQEVLRTVVSKGSESLVLAEMVVPKSGSAQAKGADLTYLKRQQATSAFGLAGEDDTDGSGENFKESENKDSPEKKSSASKKKEPTEAQQILGDLMREAVENGVEKSKLRAEIEAHIGRNLTEMNDYECEKAQNFVREIVSNAGSAVDGKEPKQEFNTAVDDPAGLYEEDVEF